MKKVRLDGYATDDFQPGKCECCPYSFFDAQYNGNGLCSLDLKCVLFIEPKECRVEIIEEAPIECYETHEGEYMEVYEE